MSACRECIFLFLGAATCETYSLVISLISENKLYRLQQGKRTCNAHKIPARSCFLARDYARLQSNVSVREYLKWRWGHDWLSPCPSSPQPITLALGSWETRSEHPLPHLLVIVPGGVYGVCFGGGGQSLLCHHPLSSTLHKSKGIMPRWNVPDDSDLY